MQGFTPIFSPHSLERVGQRLCPLRVVHGKLGHWIPPQMIQELIDDVHYSLDRKGPGLNIYYEEGGPIITQGKLCYYIISPYGDIITVYSTLRKEYASQIRAVSKKFVKSFLIQSPYLEDYKKEIFSYRSEKIPK